MEFQYPQNQGVYPMKGIPAPFHGCPTESEAAAYLEAFAFGWRNCSSYSADLPWAGSSSWATLGFVAGGIAC